MSCATRSSISSSDSRRGRKPSDDESVGALQALLADRRKLLGGVAVVVLLVFGIYVVFPKLVGLDDAVRKLDDAGLVLDRHRDRDSTCSRSSPTSRCSAAILGGTRDDVVHRRLDLKASYQITMAGLAATRIFSAAGAGGIVLTYWALRKAGMPRRRAACRMVAFLVLLLRRLPGRADRVRDPAAHPRAARRRALRRHVVPAAVSAIVVAVFLLIALIPQDVERRIQRFAGGYRRTRYLTRLAKGPATVATGVRTAIAYVRHPQRGALAVGGAVGFWAANIAVLWASFEAFGGNVPFAVLVQGFFVGWPPT